VSPLDARLLYARAWHGLPIPPPSLRYRGAAEACSGSTRWRRCVAEAWPSFFHQTPTLQTLPPFLRARCGCSSQMRQPAFSRLTLVEMGSYLSNGSNSCALGCCLSPFACWPRARPFGQASFPTSRLSSLWGRKSSVVLCWDLPRSAGFIKRQKTRRSLL
jgi:hypothetical protein